MLIKSFKLQKCKYNIKNEQDFDRFNGWVKITHREIKRVSEMLFFLCLAPPLSPNTIRNSLHPP
jgi:hypothetical protein